MEHRRFFDLQPPPIFHQQYPHHHHHHHLRYEHVLPHPPNFIPQHSHYHLPQPPPPQPHQPHNHFPQPPPPQHHRPHNHFLQLPPPQPYQLHTHFPQTSPPHPHQLHNHVPSPQPCQSSYFDVPPHRFHNFQIDLPPKPCHSNFLHPLPPSLPLPETQENTYQLFHRGENYRVGRFVGCGRGLNDERSYDVKTCHRVKNNPDSKKMVYDETRWGSIDERRMKGKEDNGGNEELSGTKEGFECLQTRTDDNKEREAILETPCPDDVKADINSTIVETGITSGTPGSPTTAKSSEDVVKADLLADDANGSGEIDVKDQSHKDMIAMSRFQSGKDCSRDNGGDEELSDRSFLRGKEKQEGFECLQTRTDYKRESEAILASTCPDDVKTDINSMIEETVITSGSPTTSKLAKDVVKADILADDPLCTSKELLDKDVIFESGLYKDRDSDERRMGVGISEGHFVRCRKKRRLQKECVMSRIQSGKEDIGGDEESSGGSFRGKENKGFECLQTRKDYGRESEAILAPPCPGVNAAGIISTLVEARITSGLSATAKSSKDVLKYVVSESGSWGDGANGSGEIAVKDQLQMLKVNVDGGAKADVCIITPSASSPPQPCSEANNDLAEIVVENQSQGDTNLHSPIVRKSSRSALRKKLKRARIKFLRKTGVQMRNDSGGDAVNANKDYIIPSASTQPRSGANNDSGEIAAKSRPPRKDVNLHSPIVCVQSRSARRKEARQKYKNLHIPKVIESHVKKRKAISHETGMMMINDGGDIKNVSDCIIPSAPPKPTSGTNVLGQIVAKSRPPIHTNLHSPTIDRSHSTHLKKWKARNKFLQRTSFVSEKARSNCDPCRPVVPNLKRTRSSSTTISPNVADSVIPECSGRAERLATSTEDEKVQQYVHQTFLAKVSSGQYVKLGTDRVDDISEHPLHNGPPLIDSFVEGITIAGSSQGDRWSSEIRACSERKSALPLKPNNSDMGSADTNANGVFLKELSTQQVSSEVNISSEANNAVSSKIWRQKCFECGELGQCSSLCLKVKAANNAVSLKKWRQKCFECRELGHSSFLCPNVKAENSVVSSNIRRRMCFECGGRGHILSMCQKVKCYECGKRGHVSLLCPKVKASNNAVSSKIRRRKCHECGEYGHISLFCPNVKADDSTNQVQSNPVGSSKLRKQKRNRKCYECRDRGHIRSLCPKIKTDDSANADTNSKEDFLKEFNTRQVKISSEANNAVYREPGHISLLRPKVKADDWTNRECDDALPLKTDSGIIFDVGSADANSKEVFLKELNTPQVVTSEVNINSHANYDVSSKKWKRKSYECGEPGHSFLLCPKMKVDDSKNPENKLDDVLKKGTVTDLKFAPKDNQVQSSYNISHVTATSKAGLVGSSKTRWQTWCECRECGHIKSLCSKIKADDLAIAISKYISRYSLAAPYNC